MLNLRHFRWRILPSYLCLIWWSSELWWYIINVPQQDVRKTAMVSFKWMSYLLLGFNELISLHDPWQISMVPLLQGRAIDAAILADAATRVKCLCCERISLAQQGSVLTCQSTYCTVRLGCIFVVLLTWSRHKHTALASFSVCFPSNCTDCMFVLSTACRVDESPGKQTREQTSSHLQPCDLVSRPRKATSDRLKRTL